MLAEERKAFEAEKESWAKSRAELEQSATDAKTTLEAVREEMALLTARCGTFKAEVSLVLRSKLA